MPLKLILEIPLHGDDEQVLHRILEKFPATIGRGFGNDVIINDPYADPQHLRIDYDGVICTVTDLGSENGFSLNGVAQRKQSITVNSGDALSIGQTKLRIFTPEQPVAAALRLQKAHPVFFWLAQPLNIWACLLLALAFTLSWSYLEIWTDEPALTLTLTAAASIGVIVLWAALWSVAGRMARRPPGFKNHAALMGLYLIAGICAWYAEAYIAFFTNGNWISRVAAYGINFVLLAFLLYGSMGIATRMPRQRRLVSAVFFSGGLMAGVLAFSLVSAKTFNQRPLYPATLEPFLSQLAPADTVAEFMAGNEKLFGAKEFNAASSGL